MKSKWWLVGYVIALGAAALSPLASGSPDGLERVAEDQGFMEREQGAGYEIIADYVMPGIDNEAVATMLAGFIGVTVMFALLYAGSWLLLRGNSQRPHQSRT